MYVVQKQTIMTAVIALLVLGWVGSAVAQTSGTAHTQSQSTLSSPVSVSPSDVQWGPGPKSLPPGAQLAVLEGDLTKAEPYVFRLKFPDGYSVPPHTHPVREHITVLAGTLMMGMGKQVNKEATRPLPPGSLFILPVGDTHYVWTKGETIVQLHGVGPWGITYVNPQDDPRN
jgi:quercetin dioxygenase-like cupin family protein